jgi:hypothetical protein
MTSHLRRMLRADHLMFPVQCVTHVPGRNRPVPRDAPSIARRRAVTLPERAVLCVWLVSISRYAEVDWVEISHSLVDG